MKVVCWRSGGVTSAVACKLAIDIFGLDSCIFLHLDTRNEHPDTIRFKEDCQAWYGKEIDSICAYDYKEYESIEDVWLKRNALNVAKGAPCSAELKIKVRKKWEKENDCTHQVMGFDINETSRAKAMTLNYPDAHPIYPLLMYRFSKKMCMGILEEQGIEVPVMYKMGFNNNNCFGTGCVQGGIGYWQKMAREFPDKFEAMAKVEHDLTNEKGQPVTMLKDQSKEAKESGLFQLFLKPHPDYPNHKDLSMIKGREPKPLLECNGFCGTNDLEPRTEEENDINYQINLF